MKTQLKFQKILFLASLIIAAIALVYGFSFCTESVAYAVKYTSATNPFSYSSGLRSDPIGADALYMFVMGAGDYISNGQWEDGWMGFNNLIVILCIVLIVIVALQYVFSTNNRRNYYISNYISVGVLVVFAIVVAAVGFWGVATTHSLFNNLDFDTWLTYHERGTLAYYTESQTIFYIGYVVFALVLVDAVLLVLCTVWKYLLMKGEKALLDGSKLENAPEPDDAGDTTDSDSNNENTVLVEEGA